jgi:hypothetical protein
MISSKKVKTASIIAYLCIYLHGQMIGLPFLLWLPITLFNFGNIDQVYSFLAIVGLVVTFIYPTKIVSHGVMVDVVCFLLLVLPLIGRLTAVPIAMFNYLGFIIPVTLFSLLYLLSIFLKAAGSKETNSIQKI